MRMTKVHDRGTYGTDSGAVAQTKALQHRQRCPERNDRCETRALTLMLRAIGGVGPQHKRVGKGIGTVLVHAEPNLVQRASERTAEAEVQNNCTLAFQATECAQTMCNYARASVVCARATSEP